MSYAGIAIITGTSSCSEISHTARTINMRNLFGLPRPAEYCFYVHIKRAHSNIIFYYYYYHYHCARDPFSLVNVYKSYWQQQIIKQYVDAEEPVPRESVCSVCAGTRIILQYSLSVRSSQESRWKIITIVARQ